jgi:hypothetical protein
VPSFNGTHDWELFSLSPVYANGYALLGQLNVMVRVSATRFSWVEPAAAAPGLTVQVTGAGGETVPVAILVPPATGTTLPLAGGAVEGTVKVVTVTLPTGPGHTSVTVVCKGSGSTAVCQASQ